MCATLTILWRKFAQRIAYIPYLNMDMFTCTIRAIIGSFRQSGCRSLDRISFGGTEQGIEGVDVGVFPSRKF